MDSIKRRIRRSHFMLHEGLLGILKNEEINGEPPSIFTSKEILIAGGVGAAVTAAYVAMRQSDSSPLSLSEVKAAEADGKEKAEKDVEAAAPEIKRESEKPGGIWQTIKDKFTKASPKKEEAKGNTIERGTAVAQPSAENLPGDYRSKFKFEGFKDADGLSRFGSYTSEEATTIISLRDAAANTRAFSKMPDSIRDKIVASARKYGVDEVLALKVAQMESGGNPNAISSTGAIGIFQFTGGSATDMGLRNRFDEDQNIDAGIRSLKKNGDSDVENTPTNLYLMHQLGRKGARELIAAARAGKSISDLSPSLQRALANNFGGSSASTAAEYISITEDALESRSTGVAFNTIKPATPTSSIRQTLPPPPTVVAVATPSKPIPSKPTQASIPPPSPSPPASPPSEGIRVARATESVDDTPPMQAPPIVQSVIRTRNGILIGST